MTQARTLRIAAALIDDEEGRLLLVRKAGTRWFMQPGGKIEAGESPRAALCREIREEIGLVVGEDQPRYLGRFAAPAANEADFTVEAEVFHLRQPHDPQAAAEIAEAIWVTREAASNLPLAPLTRDHILPLAHRL